MCRNTKILTYFTAGKGSKIKEEQYEEKIVSVLLASLMVTSMLAGCGNSSGSSSSSGAGSTGGDTTSASGTEAGDTGLTAEEQEAVDEGIIQLDGTFRSSKIRQNSKRNTENFRSDRKHCRQNRRSRRPCYVPEMVRGHRSRV